MPPDDRDEEEAERTPAATPNAKKSSGTWKFNIEGALCARRSCVHRRDEHEPDPVTPRIARRCMLCDCPEFFMGGMTEEEQRADTDKGLAAVRDGKTEK
jgi:hypothetical protein